jgi:FHS family glucose/mannose:H+ symporter-like MFS transporter
MNKLLGMSSLAYLLTGFTHVILGAVLTEILIHYGRSYSDGGILIFVEFGGFMCGVLCMPYLIRRFSRRVTISSALLMLSLVEISIAFLPAWPVTIGLALFAGVSFGVLESSIGTFVMVALKERQAVAMSQLEVAFGLGALIMPFISSLLITWGLWTYSFFLLGACAFVMSVLWSKMSLGSYDDLLAHKISPEQQGIKPASYTSASLPILGIFLLFFFLYVGMETAIVNFLPSIFIETIHASTSLSTLTVTAYWLTMVIGRIFAGMIAEKITYSRFLAIVCAGSVIVLATLPLSTSVWSGFALVLLLGLFMAGMFAIGLIFANRFLPGMTERTTSLLIASGGLGGSLLPLATGKFMDHFTAQTTVWLFAGCMLIALILILTTKRWESAK